jgi:hypothetical protein
MAAGPTIGVLDLHLIHARIQVEGVGVPLDLATKFNLPHEEIYAPE